MLCCVDLRGGTCRTHLFTGKAEVVEVEFRDGLFLRGHDRTEVRVHDFVGLVSDRKDRGQVRFQHLVVGTHGAVHANGSSVEFHLLRHRQCGQVEVGCECGGDCGCHTVKSGHARHDEIDRTVLLEAIDRGTENPGGSEDIGACCPFVADVDGAVGTECECAAQSINRIFGAHGDDDDFTVTVGQVHCFLDGVLVKFIEHIVVPADEVTRFQGSFRLNVGYVFYAYNNPHTF